MNRLRKTALTLLIGLYGPIVSAQTAVHAEAGTETSVEVAAQAEVDDAPEQGSATGSESVSETDSETDSGVATQEQAEADEIDTQVNKTAEDFDKRLDALLSEATASDAYGEPIHCLYRRKYRDIDIISEDLLLFSSGNNYWVNTLKRSCVGLRRDMVVHTVVRGISSLCQNDMVYANNSFDLVQGFMSSGRPVVVRANCVLGEFKPIDEVYAESLKAMSRR